MPSGKSQRLTQQGDLDTAVMPYVLPETAAKAVVGLKDPLLHFSG